MCHTNKERVAIESDKVSLTHDEGVECVVKSGGGRIDANNAQARLLYRNQLRWFQVFVITSCRLKWIKQRGVGSSQVLFSYEYRSSSSTALRQRDYDIPNLDIL